MRCKYGMKGMYLMSTQGADVKRPEKVPSALSTLAGWAIALLLVLVLSTTALAHEQRAARHSLDADPPEGMARAEVSVVRLLVTYQPEKAAAPGELIECTGLGVLVTSWPNRGQSDLNNWVLTDGSLVNKDNKAYCTSTQPKAALSSIKVAMNTSYTPLLLTIPVSPSPIVVQCSSNPCNKGAAVFAFNFDQTHTQPHIDIADVDATAVAGIGLSSSATSLQKPALLSTKDPQRKAQFEAQLTQYLTAVQLSLKNGKPDGEIGTPIINADGALSSMLLSNGHLISAQEISTFLRSVNELNAPPANPLHDSWNAGITSYYQKDYRTAAADFQAAHAANPEFIAAQTFAQKASTHLTSQSEGGNAAAASNRQPGGITINGVHVPFWILSILALVVLVLLLILITVLVGQARSRRSRQRRLREEYAEAERKAAIDAQRIAAMESSQQEATKRPPAELSPVRSAPVRNTQVLPCPRCGQPVATSAPYCSNCHQVLSPSESGLHLRTPRIVPVVPATPITEQPTLEMLPNNDQTMATTWPGVARNGRTGANDNDSTLPYEVQQLGGQRLGVLVGASSDPGIKRKYKPNEDSLFAAQGVGMPNAPSVPFGLFVVADGMGGHANGQDASRRAIQTIIDYMLPRLMKGGEWNSDSLAQLLSESVQQANHAVHQNNVELRADMGTTVTATLVVNATAYICNVGDSRTYIYREGEGLRKITNDHSVVASLVEAGIIKPDDIYTHPKRNQIYRSLGEKPIVEVDTFIVQLQPGDKLLLCSDGLWDMVRDPQIEEVLRTPAPDPNTTAEALIQAALQGGGEDNVSVIVVSVVETKQQTLKPGVQLLAKPDTVHMPNV